MSLKTQENQERNRFDDVKYSFDRLFVNIMSPVKSNINLQTKTNQSHSVKLKRNNEILENF